MKIALKIHTAYLPIYLLVCSLFVGNFIFQYAALAIFFLFYLTRGVVVKNNIFLFIPLVIFFIAFISYLYNMLTGLADKYAIIFWFFSYAPPFVLMWLILWYRAELDFHRVYGFYKKLVYLQTLLLIVSAVRHKTFVVGDPATGTIGDANWVAFHICVVLIFEIVKITTLSKGTSILTRRNLRSILEIFYFFVVLIIPESTANLGFLILVLGVLFFKEYIWAHISIKGMIIFLICGLIGFFILKDNFVYRRIENTITQLRSRDIDENGNFFKITIYRKIISGEIFQKANWLIGSGPSTFTSRSSVMRMPEERANDFPVNLPYFKSAVFATFISPVYADWRKSGESHGNFASPQATVISVVVELGMAGLMLFVFFFRSILQRLNPKYLGNNENEYLMSFGKYFTLFFIMSLCHLNFWEYPIVAFTYMVFVFILIKRNHFLPTP
jgi:hypothetical protein